MQYSESSVCHDLIPLAVEVLESYFTIEDLLLREGLEGIKP